MSFFAEKQNITANIHDEIYTLEALILILILNQPVDKTADRTEPVWKAEEITLDKIQAK